MALFLIYMLSYLKYTCRYLIHFYILRLEFQYCHIIHFPLRGYFLQVKVTTTVNGKKKCHI